ncbi:MAG: hypothetical protein EFT35_04730 [Methanophagales archaeon ANME-1-THS]|nr:MAG: hypothetical protein EFT35_04730 [Methanophagales archaeon ANME-1-THS]
MPKWEIHNKWAEKLGLPTEISNFVNQLSDFPEQSQAFREFCERRGAEIIMQLVQRCDFDRIMRIPKYLQVVFAREKGSEYLSAWYLHYALDYIRMAPALTPREVLNRIEERFEPCRELETIKKFVLENAEEIVRDCRA